jgi:hypothetical protein
MKPFNFTLSEALEFDYLTKYDLKDAIADYEHLMKVCEDSIGTSDPAEIPAVVDQLRNEIEEANKDAQKPSQYLSDIRRAYEERHGRIYDTPDEKLVEWVCDDINNATDADTLVIHNVDFNELERHRLVITEVLYQSDMSETQRQAMEGIINMLEAWSDENYQKTKSKAQSQPV